MRAIPSHIAHSVRIMLPPFVREVERTDTDVAILTFEAIFGEPQLLHYCVWFAACHNKKVLVLPPTEAKH